jgi:hypothetical protein
MVAIGIYPADYIRPLDYDPHTQQPYDVQRHELRIYYPDGTVHTDRILWYQVGRISARGVAELGQAFGLPCEIDNIIYSQITGKTRKLATPEERSKNLSKLSEKNK